MSSQDEATLTSRSISMSGLLSLLCGLGVVFVYLKFPHLTRAWGQRANLACFTLSILAAMWGAKQLYTGFTSQTPLRAATNRQRVMLPRPGVVYLIIMSVLFIGSLWGRSNMLMLVFALMAGPFILNGWITYSMLKRTTLERRLPEYVVAGDPVSVEILLHNRKLMLSAWLMQVTDHIARKGDRLRASVLFTRVPPRGRRAAQYQMRLMRRGRYMLGPLRMMTRFPLGLVERGIVVPLPGEIVVFPRLGRLSGSWRREHLLTAEQVQRRVGRQGTFDDDFHSLREYRWGDNPRAIHWRTSARRNQVMVREYHQSRDQHLAVLLDAWLPQRPSDNDADRVELAVSLAATICVDHMKQSSDANLMVSAAGWEPHRWEGRSASFNVEPLLRMLAVVEGGDSHDIEQLFEEAITHCPPRTRCLFVTTRPPENGRLDEMGADRLRRKALEKGIDLRRIYVTQMDEVETFFQLV